MVLDIYKKFGTNTDKEVGGVWVDWDDDTSFLVARWGNTKHAKHLADLTKPYKAQQRYASIPDKIATDIVITSMVEHILLDWKGVIADGAELPYSKKNAKTLLLALPELQKFIQDAAQNLQLYQNLDDEDAEKNS